MNTVVITIERKIGVWTKTTSPPTMQFPGTPLDARDKALDICRLVEGKQRAHIEIVDEEYNHHEWEWNLTSCKTCGEEIGEREGHGPGWCA